MICKEFPAWSPRENNFLKIFPPSHLPCAAGKAGPVHPHKRLDLLGRACSHCSSLNLSHVLDALFFEACFSSVARDGKVSMKQLKFLLSLVGSDSEYQRDQALQAESAAKRFGVALQIVYAQRDAITQSQQLLNVIQSKAADKPDAIIFEPVSETGLPQVARAAVEAGIGWCTLNLRPAYLAELRTARSSIAFGIGADHLEIGRIQGRQLAQMLPRGGEVLLIQGPSDNAAARQRSQGLQETKPGNINLRQLKSKWTEERAYQSVASFLALSTSHEGNIQCIIAHNDPMAVGAKRAFAELTAGQEQTRWLSLPFLGCDGLPESGKAWVPARKLTATVIVPANAPLAIEIFVDALKTGKRPQEYSLTVSRSFPDISLLQEVERS